MKKVLYVAQDDKSAQFRYRIKNIQEVLKQSKGWGVEYIFTRQIINRGILDGADLLVIERQTAKDDALLDFLEAAKTQGTKVLFDLDDLIFDYRDLPLLMWSTKSKNVFYWLGYFWGVRRIARKVDGFICTNDFLGKKLKRSFGKPYRVIRNSLNERQIKVSNEAIKKEGNNKKEFWIGYFSGSPTHTRDFAMVESEVERFLERHKDVRLRLVGYMDLSKSMQKLENEGRVELLPVVDPLKLQRLMAEVDVNIAPLVVNDFTNCKSELKFFEAALVETTTIASPTYTFKKAIKDGETGYLAKPGEWLEKLEYLYKHSEKNKKIAKVARKYALEHYYGAEFLKEVEAAYDYFAK